MCSLIDAIYLYDLSYALVLHLRRDIKVNLAVVNRIPCFINFLFWGIWFHSLWVHMLSFPFTLSLPISSLRRDSSNPSTIARDIARQMLSAARICTWRRLGDAEVYWRHVVSHSSPSAAYLLFCYLSQCSEFCRGVCGGQSCMSTIVHRIRPSQAYLF